MVDSFRFPRRFENAAHRSRNHQIFVGSNDANPRPAGVRRDRSRSFRIARLTQRDAEETQPAANAPVALPCGREMERQIRPVHADAINRSRKASLHD